MFLKKSIAPKTGRVYLSIVQGYRTADKKTRHRTVMKIGYLDELEKEYEDPIVHFREVAKKMDDERLASGKHTITLDADAMLSKEETNRKNYGHIIPSMVYHELEIDRFLNNARRHKNFKFNTDSIMRLHLFCRLLYPGSKSSDVANKDRFFDSFKFSIDTVYDALDHFDEIDGALLRHLHEKVTEQYGRETDLVYYDVTNYYFEIDKQDELRRKGPEKNHRKDPIVQMGLLMDKMGLPISYKIFPGNTHDSQTLMPVLTDIKKQFGTKRIITVADKGLNSGDNIAYSTVLKDGYIFSKSVRGASKEFKEWVLDQSDYLVDSGEYKLKSKIVPDATVKITDKIVNGRKRTKTIHVEQKWVVFYSEKYAVRAKRKREEAIEKALQLMANPSKYRRTFDYGAVGYIANIKIDKETKELANVDEKLYLDEEKIAEEEKYDGYYAIVTGELDDDDRHIIELYRGLWRIEDSFKVTKSTLEARPIYLSTPAHINAHFLICFIALLIARIIELRLGHKYPIDEILDTLSEVECSRIDQNLWLFDKTNTLTDDINAAFGTNIGRKVMTLKEIRENLGLAKSA